MVKGHDLRGPTSPTKGWMDPLAEVVRASRQTEEEIRLLNNTSNI